MNLGSLIRDGRAEAGLTQADLAERIGVQQSYVSQLEKNNRTPSAPILHRLGAVLGWTVEQRSEALELADVQAAS